MKIIHEEVAVSYDGTKFYGDNKKEECKKHDNLILKELEDKMWGSGFKHVEIYNKDKIFCKYTTPNNTPYVKLNSWDGKHTFLEWCNLQGMNMVANNVHTAIFGKWYRMTQSDDLYSYNIDNIDIDTYIESFTNISNELKNYTMESED